MIIYLFMPDLEISVAKRIWKTTLLKTLYGKDQITILNISRTSMLSQVILLLRSSEEIQTPDAYTKTRVTLPLIVEHSFQTDVLRHSVWIQEKSFTRILIQMRDENPIG